MKIVATILSFLLLATAGTTLFVHAADEECIRFGSFDLKPVEGGGLKATYEPTASLPFHSGGNTICKFKLKADCTSNGPGKAPTCDWELDLKLNKGGQRCSSTSSSRREGKIFAYGTGPPAYSITSGTGDFFNHVHGKLDSVFNLGNKNLENFKTVGNICYYGNSIENGVIALESLQFHGSYLDAGGDRRAWTAPKDYSYNNYRKWRVINLGDNVVALESMRFRGSYLDAGGNRKAWTAQKDYSYNNYRKWKVVDLGNSVIALESMRFRGSYLDAGGDRKVWTAPKDYSYNNYRKWKVIRLS